MADVIYLNPERVAQARLRIAGRYLDTAPLSPEERARRRRHGERMLAFCVQQQRTAVRKGSGQ
jgi:hypothetical protein